MQLRTLKSLRNTVSQDTQPSNGSLTESQLIIQAEESRMILLTGLKRSQVLHHLQLLEKNLTRRLELPTLLLLSSVMNHQMNSKSSKMPHLEMTRELSSILAKIQQPNMVLLLQRSFYSETSTNQRSYSMES